MNANGRPTGHLTPTALSPDALYGKAALYARRALLAKEEAEEDAYQLWSTLALELLGKCALARIHPSLVVDAKTSNSMLEACGVSTATAVRTIDANEVFLRLKHVVPGFNALAYDACKALSERRNAELHSGQAAYVGIGLEAWEGKLWHSMRLILQAMDRGLADLIGGAATEKEALIEHLAHLTRETAMQNIIHAREAFENDEHGKRRSNKVLDDSRNRTRDLKWWQFPPVWQSNMPTAWERVCPSCGSKAFLAGEKDFEEIIDAPDIEPGYEEVRTTYTPVFLVCSVCTLRLDGSDELAAAGMDTEVVETTEREISYEPDYGND